MSLLIVVGVVLIALAAGAVVVLTMLSRSAAVTPGPGAASSPIPSASPRIVTPTPIPTVTPQPPAPPVVRRARVVNTNGQGALIRREPSVNAPSESLVSEDAELILLGPEETVQAQVWRQVEDGQGNQGWIRADFLAVIEPSPTIPLAPTP